MGGVILEGISQGNPQIEDVSHSGKAGFMLEIRAVIRNGWFSAAMP